MLYVQRVTLFLECKSIAKEVLQIRSRPKQYDYKIIRTNGCQCYPQTALVIFKKIHYRALSN